MIGQVWQYVQKELAIAVVGVIGETGIQFFCFFPTIF
jgi:hypothetical protein